MGVTERRGAGAKLRDVPVEERTTKADRCSQHPGSASVGSCDGCGRALCLACAIPVRGLVLGSECLGQVLGEDAPTDEPVVPRRVGPAAVAFAAAVLATLPPWTTIGRGSGAFGAWSTSPRWSLLAAVAAAAGLLIEIVLERLDTGAIAPRAVAMALGLAVVAGSVIAWFRPPFPADPLVTPWIAAAAGAVAAAFAAADLRRYAGQRG